MVAQTLRNLVKAAAAGRLNGGRATVVTPEQMKLSRLRAENVRLKGENEILKKSDGVLRKGHAVKYALIDEQRNDYARVEMCSNRNTIAASVHVACAALVISSDNHHDAAEAIHMMIGEISDSLRWPYEPQGGRDGRTAV